MSPSVEPVIDCVDCGGRAHLITTWPADDPPMDGDVVAYVCAECWERLDLVVAQAGDVYDEGDDVHGAGETHR